MASWTTTARVARYLPTNYATYLTTPLASLITQASDIAYGDLSPRYWPFQSAGSDPDCPEIIQATVAYLAAHLARLELGRSNELTVGDNQEASNLLMLYHDRVERLKSEDNEKRIQVPLLTISGEPMTFGTSPHYSYQHKLTPGADDEGDWASIGLTGFEVIPESVQIAGYKNGVDFAAKFYPEFRCWMLDRYNGSIVDDTTVSYDVDMMRRREISKPESRYSIEMVRG